MPSGWTFASTATWTAVVVITFRIISWALDAFVMPVIAKALH
jgi:hypothetical protein